MYTSGHARSMYGLDFSSDWNPFQALYGHPDSSAWSELALALRESVVLLLGYSEDFAALVEQTAD
ncbi:hypothetical protein ABH935_001087 [Catenulispora sp. GAS73]|uniref:hypothetical protein n=1 Tax=Catenulispora sp. GAS73 TaxID=3156269 RepID=UPI003517A60B